MGAGRKLPHVKAGIIGLQHLKCKEQGVLFFCQVRVLPAVQLPFGGVRLGKLFFQSGNFFGGRPVILIRQENPLKLHGGEHRVDALGDDGRRKI